MRRLPMREALADGLVEVERAARDVVAGAVDGVTAACPWRRPD